jgi:hypothetical protein
VAGTTWRQRYRPVRSGDRPSWQEDRTVTRGCARPPTFGDYGQCQQSRRFLNEYCAANPGIGLITATNKLFGKSKLADLGGTPLVGSPADFAKLIADETEKWGNVVKFVGIKAD